MTMVESNVARIAGLLPGATITITPHVAQLVTEGEDAVVALVTADSVELRLPTVDWTAGTHDPREASRFWKRLSFADLPDEALAAEIAEAGAARRNEFATCRYCGERVPAEHRFSSDVCHGCASHHEGVVF